MLLFNATGQRVDLRDALGNTAIHVAAALGATAVLEVLLRHSHSLPPSGSVTCTVLLAQQQFKIPCSHKSNHRLLFGEKLLEIWNSLVSQNYTGCPKKNDTQIVITVIQKLSNLQNNEKSHFVPQHVFSLCTKFQNNRSIRFLSAVILVTAAENVFAHFLKITISKLQLLSLKNYSTYRKLGYNILFLNLFSIFVQNFR